jgi:hypothetical protein
MGFKLEYLEDGTVKGVLDLKEEGQRKTFPKLENLQEISEAEKPLPTLKKSKETKPETKAAVPM